MVKTPKTGQSRGRRQPVTIDLDAEAVKGPESAGDTAAVPRQTDTVADPTAPQSPVETRDEAARSEAPASDTVSPAPGPVHGVTETGGSASESRPDKSSGTQDAHKTNAPTPTRGRGALVAAGVVGGVVTLLGAGALQWAGALPAPGGNTAQIAELESRIVALQPAADAASRIEALGQAVQGLQGDLAALRDAPPTAGDNAALASLEERLKTAESTLAGLGQGIAGDADARIAALESEVKASADAAGETGQRLAEVEQTLNALSSRVEAQAQQPKIALSIAAAGLKTALERGAPFVAELETFAAIAPQASEIEALRAHAEAGVPTRADLVAEMPKAAAAMAAAASPLPEDAGFFERLLASAESLISVRPVGDVKGDDPASMVARMEVAVNGGDYAKALAEYETLPDAARAAGADFAARLKARHDVEQLVDRLIAGAMRA